MKPGLLITGLVAFGLSRAPAANAGNYIVHNAGPAAAIRMRASASNRSKTIAYIPPDTIVAAAGDCTGTWCQVSFKNLTGWVYRAYLTETTEPVTPMPALDQPAQAMARAHVTPSESPGSRNGAPVNVYKVEGLGADQWLSMREQPSDASIETGVLPPDAEGIEDLEKCVRQWCLVRYKGAEGYVERRFLAQPGENLKSRYRVNGIGIDEELSVLDFPGSDATPIGAIPSYASGIVPIGDCDREWCHIRYLGLVGWVDASKLAPEE